jgi:hypothetical protein
MLFTFGIIQMHSRSSDCVLSEFLPVDKQQRLTLFRDQEGLGGRTRSRLRCSRRMRFTIDEEYVIEPSCAPPRGL